MRSLAWELDRYGCGAAPSSDQELVAPPCGGGSQDPCAGQSQPCRDRITSMPTASTGVQHQNLESVGETVTLDAKAPVIVRDDAQVLAIY